MQLVRLPAWLYAVLGVALVAAGLVDGRWPIVLVGGVTLAVGVARFVGSRG